MKRYPALYPASEDKLLDGEILQDLRRGRTPLHYAVLGCPYHRPLVEAGALHSLDLELPQQAPATCIG
jgi:hypothetical protein